MKIGLVSLGCPKNLVDSEVMLGLARDAGHEITQDAADADVLVVNTCAFIDAAKQESIDTILEMASRKTEGACQRSIVTGCLGERYREPSARTQSGGRARMDPPAVPLPHDDRRRDAGRDGGVRKSVSLRRPAAAARVEPGPQAHEAARHP